MEFTRYLPVGEDSEFARRWSSRPAKDERLDMKFFMEFFTLTLFTLLVTHVYGGFGPPVDRHQLYKQLYGAPCDCPGGTVNLTPRPYSGQPAAQGEVDLAYLAQTDCGTKIAYLAYDGRPVASFGQTISKPKWTCINKPQVQPTIEGQPPPCPIECNFKSQMHASCYSQAQTCTSSNNTVYLTATLLRTKAASVGGDWASTSVLGSNKFGQAACSGTPHTLVCWPLKQPTHISDGGGPNDMLKQAIVTERIQ